MPDPIAVNSMFGGIAHRYDLANRLLSGGMDRSWRRHLVAAVRAARPRRILDLATGSGDVAFALSRGISGPLEIVGMDFCQPMLDQALAKQQAAAGEYPNIMFLPGDSLSLPVPDASFDAVTISFGLRNLADRHRGLQEMRRVLKADGRLHVLEFSQPDRWCRAFYFFYLRHILPRVAGLVTGDRAAYEYLNASIGEFPDRESLTKEISAAGFSAVTARPLTFGTVALHLAQK